MPLTISKSKLKHFRKIEELISNGRRTAIRVILKWF
jgi:hypothetical protein